MNARLKQRNADAHATITESIDETAALWAVQLSAGGADSAMITMFEAWLVNSPLHMKAFDEACLIWRLIGTSKGIETHFKTIIE